jgi:hypothetical protein
MIDPAILKPGDSILYKPSSLAGVIIAFKTWTWLSHVEGYVGDGMSIGARIEGVNIYPLRNDKSLRFVMRPNQPFDLVKAMAWFNAEAKGDHYAVDGLFSFLIPKGSAGPKNPHEEFCSQLMDMWYDAGLFHAFNPKFPARRISPAQFIQTPALDQIYPT